MITVLKSEKRPVWSNLLRLGIHARRIMLLCLSLFFMSVSDAQNIDHSLDIPFVKGWDTSKHVRELADVNGDGRADIVGFGSTKVWVALGQEDGKFGKPIVAIEDYCYKGGYRVEKHVRRLAYVNDDKYADIVAFGTNAVYVSLGKEDGTFQPAKKAIADFCSSKTWKVEQHVRRVADVNGDGRADIVGFGGIKTYVSLGNGEGTFQERKTAIEDYCYNDGYRKEKHVRRLANVNNDKYADIVAFGGGAVYVSLGKGNGTFQPAKIAIEDFCHSQGWNTTYHIRKLADINKDGFADIVAFRDGQMYYALADGKGKFSKKVALHKGFWGFPDIMGMGTPVLLGDINGDSEVEILDFYNKVNIKSIYEIHSKADNDRRNAIAKKVISFTFRNGRTFNKIADRVWVEKSPGGKNYVGIYEELEIVSGKIKLHDYDTNTRYELNIADRRLESNGKSMPGAVLESGIEYDNNKTFKELHRVQLLGKTLFAYNKDNVYGQSNGRPGCSWGDPTYSDIFFPACEKHDKYYRAPWGDAGFSEAEGQNISDHLFFSQMMKICDDGDFSFGNCHIGSAFWKGGLEGFGTFKSAQREEESDRSAKILYRIPDNRLNPILERRRDIYPGHDLEVGDHYQVWIDMKGSGDDDFETESLVTIEFFDKYDLSIGYETSHGISGTFWTNSKKTSLYTERKPAYFVISILGDDAFYMDQVKFMKNGDTVQTYGRNGGSGWCISTDPSDEIDEREDGDKHIKCYPGFKFMISTGKVYRGGNIKIKKWPFDMDKIKNPID